MFALSDTKDTKVGDWKAKSLKVHGSKGMDLMSKKPINLTHRIRKMSKEKSEGGSIKQFSLQNLQEEIDDFDEDAFMKDFGQKEMFKLEDLKFIRVIGAGAFGTIDKMIHEPTGTMLAIKRMPHNTTNKQV